MHKHIIRGLTVVVFTLIASVIQAQHHRIEASETDAIQYFEHGIMLWDNQSGGIWVLYGHAPHDAAFYPDTTYAAFSDNSIAEVAPSGLFKPVSGFGKVWGNVESVRNRLGWALSPEVNFAVNIRRGPNTAGGFSQQLANLPDGQTVVLRSDDTWGYVGVPRQINELPYQTSFPATFQAFEGGYMLWWSETGSVWVLYNSGETRHFEPEQFGTLPPNPITQRPPTGLFKPRQGFGKVWGHFSDVRNRLGWATAVDSGYTMTFERRATQRSAFGLRVSLIVSTPGGALLELDAYGRWHWRN